MIDIPFTTEKRIDLIKLAIKTTNAKSYLEIGCDKDQIFSRIDIDNKIGVDPVRGGNRRMTSDEFFEQNDQTFDVIFIDGLHYYDQVTKDVNNAIEVLNPHGIIIIHDMLPENAIQASVPFTEKAKYKWLGDVWRLGFDLMARTNVIFNLVLIDCGCGVVTRGPQEPKFVNVDESWQSYKANWTEYPLRSYSEFSHMLPTLTRL
jgi:predicted O-methyltransferase YrrM